MKRTPRLPLKSRVAGQEPATQPGLPVPGCGAPPDRAGLYWVGPVAGSLSSPAIIAVVEGEAPFLEIRLIDPIDHTSPRLKPSANQVAMLSWLGEIERPAPALARQMIDSAIAAARGSNALEGRS